MAENRTAEEYARQIQRLRPPGKIWLPEDDGSYFWEIAMVIGAELARLDEAACKLFLESLADQADQTLPEWEFDYGLPSTCATEEQSQSLRKLLLAAKARKRNLTARYLMETIERVGYYAFAIETFRPFRAGESPPDGGSFSGDALTQDQWQHTFRVHAPEVAVAEFKSGANTCIDPLRWFGNEVLACIVEEHRAAHMHALFVYAGVLFDDLAAWGAVQGFPPVYEPSEGNVVRSHTGAFRFGNVVNVQAFYGPTSNGLYPAAGTMIYPHILVKRPTTGLPAADDFSISLVYDNPATPVAGSDATFAWQADGSLAPSGGSVAGAYAEHVDDNWWRAVVPWSVTATETGLEQWMQFGPFPASAPPPGQVVTILVSGGGISHFRPNS